MPGTNLGSSHTKGTYCPLHFTANKKAVSFAIIVEPKEEGKNQSTHRPIYYVSEVLTLSKQRYPHASIVGDKVTKVASHEAFLRE